MYQKLLSQEWWYLKKALTQPTWGTKKSPEQHKEGPALNTQGGKDETRRKNAVKQQLWMSEILVAFTWRFLKHNPSRFLGWAGSSLRCAYSCAEGDARP